MYISYFITPSCTQKAQLKKQEITPQKYKKKKTTKNSHSVIANVSYFLPISPEPKTYNSMGKIFQVNISVQMPYLHMYC